ncbi:MAG: dihydroneopterin aldolase [Deltaproteobacteria bacterium]
MDKIIAKGMRFIGCHGVLSEEKTEPQVFIVDLELFLDLRPAEQEDNLELTVDYSQIYEMVKKIVEEKSFNLIEALAGNIAAQIIERFPVQSAGVTVYKPQAPVQGEFDYFAVSIQREQEQD